MFLLVRGRTGSPIRSGLDTPAAADERRPSPATLSLSALSVVLLWMFLPQVTVCVVICLAWKLHRLL